MRRLIAARLGQSLIVVFLVTTISFFVIRLAPGDPFSYTADTMTPAQREYWRHRFGYDRPLGEQYVRYVSAVAQGDFGFSSKRRQNVSVVLGEALPRTLLLSGLGLVFSFAIGIVVGVLQAVNRGRWFDRVSSGVLLFFYSLPDFWGALMILLIFAYWLPILPAGGIVNPSLHDYLTGWYAALDVLKHLVLPLFSLVLLSVAAVARYQRTAMLEVLPSDYIRTARAKGLPERRVIWGHALRTALTPMVTLLGLMLPAYIGGTVFIEAIFQWPGIGMLATDSIASRDYDVVTATVIIGAVLVVIGNLIADLLHMAIDPRVRE